MAGTLEVHTNKGSDYKDIHAKFKQINIYLQQSKHNTQLRTNNLQDTPS